MIRSPKFKPRPRSDLILLNSTKFTTELTNDFKINTTIDTTINQVICDIIRKIGIPFVRKLILDR